MHTVEESLIVNSVKVSEKVRAVPRLGGGSMSCPVPDISSELWSYMSSIGRPEINHLLVKNIRKEECI